MKCTNCYRDAVLVTQDGQLRVYCCGKCGFHDAIKVHLIVRGDSLKSNWFLWECDLELCEHRKIIRGTVQADYAGELRALETFESDEL